MLSILKYPHPILIKKCSLVENFDKQLSSLVNEMFETMRHNHGIGLAANQIGISKFLFIMEIDSISYTFINPKIIDKSQDFIQYTEGCLSFPTIEQNTERSKTITIEWQNLLGISQVQTFSNLHAICIQHEIDHLNGKTFFDLLSPLKKQFAIKKYLKIQKS